MRTLAAIFVPFYCAIGAAPSIDSLVAAARTAPGEFAADTLLRIAALESLPRERRIELLEQAFERAAFAQQPYKRVAALVRMVGPVGIINRTYNQDLDSLSLRLRAIEGILPLDAARAREFFFKIPELKLPRATCNDFLVYDVNRYYHVLEALLLKSDDAERVRLLARASAGVASPVQLAGMARVLAKADVPDADFQKLVASFAGAMSKITGDDRSFTYSRGIGLEIEALSAECQRRGVSPLPLLEGYRVYLVFNLSSTRCGDNDLMQGGGIQAFAQNPAGLTEPQAADFAGFFNAKLRIAPLQPIHELESTPTRLEGVASGIRTCQDPKCKALAELSQSLVIGENNSPIPPAQRATPEWQKKVQDVLQALIAWKDSTHDTPLELFRAKATVYGDLLNLVPSGAPREAVLRAFLEFLTLNPLQKSHRLEWFLAVNGMIARASLDPLGYAPFVAEMLSSKDPIIAIYAGLEAVAPRPPDRILSLL